MPATRYTPAEIVARVNALLDLDADAVNVEQLRDELIIAFANMRGTLFFDEVDAFITGDDDVKSIATTNLSAGEIITVVVSNTAHNFVLVAATCDADVSPYIIKPVDYNADTNKKYWRKANCYYQEFVNADLDGNAIDIAHSMGVKYGNVIIFNGSDELVPPCVAAALSGETNANVIMKDADTITLTFAGAITGTYKILYIV